MLQSTESASSPDLVPPVPLPEEKKDNPHQNYETFLKYLKDGFGYFGSYNFFS